MHPTDILWFAALSAGFLGSPHCLGMCGGIVTAFGLSMQNQSPAQRAWLTGCYHLGRLMSYASLGLLMGWLGSTVLGTIAHTFWPRALVAVVLMILGLSMLGAPLLSSLERLGAKLWQALSPLRQQLFPLTTPIRALAAGLLWGLLPCGLVYGALLLSVNAGSALGGAGVMLLFGLGTLPMLLLTAQITQWLSLRIQRLHLRQINGILLILAGLWTLSPLWLHTGSHAMSHTAASHTPTTNTTSQPLHHDMSQMDHEAHMHQH